MTRLILNIKLVKIEDDNCLIWHLPEGISMAVPMKNGGMKIAKVIFYVVLSGITTGVGAFFGAIVGCISEEVISICLSFAAGAMLYIVSGELVPEANNLYHGRMTAVRKHGGIFNWYFCNSNLGTG